MEITDLFGRFQLDVIPDSWVEIIWKGDFWGEQELPSEYELILEEIGFADSINCFSEVIREWVSTDADIESDSLSVSSDSLAERKSWQALISKNVNHRALIAVLSTFIKEDIKELRNPNDIILALQASRLYFMLLSIPGGHVFNVFNSVLFRRAVDILKIFRIVFSERTSQPTEKKKNKTKKNQEGRMKEKKKNDGEFQRDEDEDEYENEINLSYSSTVKIKLLETATAVLNDLAFCLQNLQLKYEKDSLMLTIQNLIIIATLERSSNVLSRQPKSNTVADLSYKSFQILDDICDSSFGNLEEIVRFLMKGILPCLCPGEEDFFSNSSSRSHNVHRENILTFIYRIISKVGEASYSGVIALVQQLCLRVPDKADVRSKCVHLIVNILENLSPVMFQHLIVWILSLSHAESVRHRIVGMEILTFLLHSAHHSYNTAKSSESSASSSSGRALSTRSSVRAVFGSSETRYASSETPFSLPLIVAAVVSKCADISPSVRTKALTTLASIIVNKQAPVEEIIFETFINSYLEVDVIDKLRTNERKFFDFRSFFNNNKLESSKGWHKINLISNPMPGGTFIMDLVEKLTHDDKVFVKKAALSVLCNICLLSAKWITPYRIQLIIQSCKDISLIIRKHMISCLTDLLLIHPTKNELAAAWVDGVFPLIGDNEIKSQEKVLETASKLIIDNMDYHNRSLTPYSLIPWKIISLICTKGRRKLFRIVCKYWATAKKIRPNELNVIRSHIGTENNLSALFLLVSISEHQDIYNTDLLLESYYAKVCYNENNNDYECQLILEGIFLSLHEIKENTKRKLCSTIKEAVTSFSVPLPLISRSIDIYHRTFPNDIKDWTEKLVKDSELHLCRIFDGNYGGDINETILRQYIFTLGEAAMTSPRTVSGEIISNLVDVIDIYNENNSTAIKWKDKLNAQTLSVIVVTLGKLCLQDPLLSKSVLQVLIPLLDGRTASDVKINSLVALTDLCIRHTSLVEIYLGDMCVCLKDRDFSVRKITLTMLMQLLKEDFLKLRGPYFFYILSMLEDETEEIREETSSFIINCAMIKQKNLMSNFFVQALYFFNDYEGEKQYSKVGQGPQERVAFSLSGDRNREIRRKLYKFMLEHVEDDHRFKITHKLSTDILYKVSQGAIKLEGNGSLLLEDALFCLACDEIRLVHMNQSKGLSDDGSGEFNSDEIISNICKRTIISQALKKDYVDVIVPTILNLKAKLIEFKSPLVRDLRVALRELMKDFKDEINEILANDAEAAAEVSLELHKIEEEERAQLSPSVHRQYEQQVVMLENLYVHCERLSKEVLSEFGCTLPDSQPNVPTNNEEPSIVNSEEIVINNCLENSRQLTPRTNRTSPRKKSANNLSLSHKINSEKSGRQKHFMTAYSGDSPQSTPHNSMRDGNNRRGKALPRINASFDVSDNSFKGVESQKKVKISNKKRKRRKH